MPYVLVENSRRALAVMAANYYGHPADSMTMVAVTGTNGKTTTTYLLKAILEQELGAKVITMSDSNGCIYDPEGIRLDVVKDIKLRRRGRIREYAQLVPGSEFRSDFRDLWSVPCDVALPCATQNEIDAETARRIVRGGAMALAEGANMPSPPAAIEVLREGGVLFAPAKAANAGGVAVSGLEMCQNSMRLAWTFDEVDQRLHQIMLDIFHNIYDASVEYGVPGNLLDGANIAGFRKVADAMLAQGVC